MSEQVSNYIRLGDEMLRAGRLELAADFYVAARRELRRHVERRREVREMQ